MFAEHYSAKVKRKKKHSNNEREQKKRREHNKIRCMVQTSENGMKQSFLCILFCSFFIAWKFDRHKWSLVEAKFWFSFSSRFYQLLKSTSGSFVLCPTADLIHLFIWLVVFDHRYFINALSYSLLWWLYYLLFIMIKLPRRNKIYW